MSGTEPNRYTVCGAVQAIACNSMAREKEKPALIREKIRGLIYCKHCWNEYGQDCGFGGAYVDICSCLRSPLHLGPHPTRANTDLTYFEQIDVPSLEAYVAQGNDRDQESAEKYLELAKHHNGKIPQTFRYPKIGFGRRRVPKGQPSLQSITRECREAAMIRGRHQIWDIVNCYPNIGLQMATKMRGCNHDEHALHTLDDYCRDRNPFLEEISSIYTYIDNPPQHCTVKDAKILFTRILSGGNLEGWKRDLRLEARRKHEKFGCIHMRLFMKFLVDCSIVDDLISHEARRDLLQRFRNEQRGNPCATAKALAFEEIEDGALVIAEEEVRRKLGSSSVQGPIFDALAIIAPFGVSPEAVQGIFTTAESRIYNELGYKLKFSRSWG